MRWHSWSRRDAVSLLFALWKKERYEARGFRAMVHHGIFPNDKPWEVYTWRERQCPTCHGSGTI